MERRSKKFNSVILDEDMYGEDSPENEVLGKTKFKKYHLEHEVGFSWKQYIEFSTYHIIFQFFGPLFLIGMIFSRKTYFLCKNLQFFFVFNYSYLV
jgi:hypothetical protein